MLPTTSLANICDHHSCPSIHTRASSSCCRLIRLSLCTTLSSLVLHSPTYCIYLGAFTSMSGIKLRRVNNDTSWLITIDTNLEFPTSTFNLLIDPWLDDSEQVDYHAAFSKQKRTSPALARSIQELVSILEQEDNAKAEGEEEEKRNENRGEEGTSRRSSKQIDAILLSHPFTDHMHPPTLQSLISKEKKIPFLVTQDSKTALETLLGKEKKAEKQGRFILQMSTAKCDETPMFLKESNAPSKNESTFLPSNLEILQILPQERFSLLSGPAGIAWGKLHGGIVILFKSPNTTLSSEDIVDNHSILYSPHGITPLSIPSWLQSTHIQNDAILTSLDKIALPDWLSGIVNLGLPSVIESIKRGVFDAKYIVATHEERKEAKGLVAMLIRRYWLGLETPDAKNQGLLQLKQRDENRQREAQEIVDTALTTTGKTAKVLVLGVGESFHL